MTVDDHPVDDVLHRYACEVRQTGTTEFGQHAETHRSLIAAEHARLISVTGALRTLPSRAPVSQTPQTSRSVVAVGARIVPRRRATMVSERHAFAAANVEKLLRMRLFSRALHTLAR
jgi:hypothetical protein